MSDLFHDAMPLAFVRKVWSVMEQTPWHTYQILTKRPERMAVMTATLPVLSNVWLGTSVENADYLDRISYHYVSDASAPPIAIAGSTDTYKVVRAVEKAMLSITSPKDGRTLRIFRCECGKLTSAENHCR